MDKKNTFISYSHIDKYFLEGVVDLLRSQGGIVFFDSDSITPGAKWRDALQNAISAADQMIIIWCCHSAKSKEVAAEIEFGLGLNKPIIPVLCCDFPVEDKLSEFQWIDIRKFVDHKTCEHHDIWVSTDPDLIEEQTIISNEEVLEQNPSRADKNMSTKFNLSWKRFRWLLPLFTIASIVILMFLEPPFFVKLFDEKLISSSVMWDIMKIIVGTASLVILIKTILNFNGVSRTKNFEMEMTKEIGEFKGGSEIIIKAEKPIDESQAAKLILSAIEETHADPTRYYPKKD